MLRAGLSPGRRPAFPLGRRSRRARSATRWPTTGSSDRRRASVPPRTATTYSRAESFGYDADGALASITHDGRTTTLAHGAAGWTTSLTDWRSPSPRQSTTTYFPSGAPRELRQNNNLLLGASDYQPDGSLKALTWSTGTTTLRSHALQYDVRGLPTTDAMAVRQPGATSTTSGTATFGFDLVDRLTGWVAPFAESDGSRNWTQVLDDAGNITQETVRTGTAIGGGSTISDSISTFPTGQLATRTTTAGGSLGTRVCEKFAYSTVGEETARLLTSQPALLSCPATPAAARTTTYDPAAHTATLDDQTSANQDATYVYSADGRLVARTNPGSTGSAKTALYFHRATDGSLAEELDGTGQTMVRYLTDDHGLTMAQESHRLANGSRGATAVWTWLLSDAGGNVGTITDDSGVVLEQEGYDYYGAVKKGGMGTPASGSAGSSLGFQGALTDRNPSDGKTRSVILRDRQYDPSVRRFMTSDTDVAATLDVALGTDVLTGNRYLFAAANPVAYFDDGHWPSAWRKWRKPPSTALDELIERLQVLSDKYDDTGDFVRAAAWTLSGYDAGTTPFPVGTLFGPRVSDRVPSPALGRSGWKTNLTDNDNNPARHFVGFVATGYFHPRTASTQLAIQEAPTRRGASVQDIRSGRIAIRLGQQLRRGEISRQQFLRSIRTLVGDPHNDGVAVPTPERPTSTPAVCRVLSQC